MEVANNTFPTKVKRKTDVLTTTEKCPVCGKSAIKRKITVNHTAYHVECENCNWGYILPK